jgi:hypothetical protein
MKHFLRCRDELKAKDSYQTGKMFAVIVEFNHKERETFIHYCKRDGNEEALGKLMRAIQKADPDTIHGDVSTFTCAWGVVPEEAVDVHVLLRELGTYDHMFHKHVGILTCPEFSDDPQEIARKLDEHFYGCRLGDWFKKSSP